MEKFAIGLAIGAGIGALVVANNCKMRMLVRKGQEEIKQRLDEMMDEKLKDLTQGGEQEQSQDSQTPTDGGQDKNESKAKTTSK